MRFLVEFLRIGNWRLGDIPTAQLFGIAFVLVGIGIMVVRRRQGAPILAPAERRFGADDDGGGDGEDADGAGGGDDDFAEFDRRIKAGGDEPTALA